MCVVPAYLYCPAGPPTRSFLVRARVRIATVVALGIRGEAAIIGALTTSLHLSAGSIARGAIGDVVVGVATLIDLSAWVGNSARIETRCGDSFASTEGEVDEEEDEAPEVVSILGWEEMTRVSRTSADA